MIGKGGRQYLGRKWATFSNIRGIGTQYEDLLQALVVVLEEAWEVVTEVHDYFLLSSLGTYAGSFPWAMGIERWLFFAPSSIGRQLVPLFRPPPPTIPLHPPFWRILDSRGKVPLRFHQIVHFRLFLGW
ncbi:hypothetical protein Salat_2414300 [Sesamum alatum]|uniref:Uncharacterized protein n=1 Tax=Sesamum alatum TaxID=300844 RepID=A0AAE1XYL1_9LAMI|nr:hypothetical protein Salat_2414300 [Sesamum alatum]